LSFPHYSKSAETKISGTAGYFICKMFSLIRRKQNADTKIDPHVCPMNLYGRR
jgi:hypothetical protein